MKLKTVLFSLILCSLSFGQSVAVYSKEDALNSNNITIPRIQIKNMGNQDVNGFIFYYYVTIPSAKTLALSNWWTPDINVSLEKVTNTVYRVKFDGSGKMLPAGAVLPSNDGYCIGLHYTDWTGMYKGDDPSFIASDTFTLNNNIPVYNTAGNLIAGGEPVFPQPAGELGMEVYVRDESYGSLNQSTPRFYLVNTGTQTISDFAIAYYFTTENGKEPILAEYYLPNASDVDILRVRDDLYKAVFNFHGVAVEPGETFPNNSGVSFGLHYNDYSNWDITSDFSNPQTSSFVKTDKITVLDSSGRPIYGISPENNPRLFPLSAVLRGIPHEVLSYTVDYYRENMDPFPSDVTEIPSEVFYNIVESVMSRHPSFDFDTLSENTAALQPIFDDFPNMTQEEVVANLSDIIRTYEAIQVYEVMGEVKSYFADDLNFTRKSQGITAMANIGDPVYDYLKVNKDEFWYIVKKLNCAPCIWSAKNKAINYTENEFYKGIYNQDNVGDAFRHMSLNAFLVAECKDKFNSVDAAVKFAKGLTDVHEYGADQDINGLSAQMDLHNNKIGLDYIRSKSGIRRVRNFWLFGWHYKNVIDVPSDNTIANDIKAIADAGKTFDDIGQLSCLSEHAVWIGSFNGCPPTIGAPGNISYQVYVAKRGWLGTTWLFPDKKWLSWAHDGNMTGGGDNYQIEAIKIRVENGPPGMGVEYRARVQGSGWFNWVQNGQTAGTTGDWKRMEAIEIRLVGAPPGYGVTYRVRVQNKGWQPWVSNGNTADNTGGNRRIEKIEIKLIKPSF